MNDRRTRRIRSTLLACAAALAPLSALALGIRIPDQDAAATARGEAFAATADNPSAIYYNPAGITQLDGQNIRLGFYGIDLGSHFKNGATSADTIEKVQAVPQLFYTAQPKSCPVTFGLGVYSPYGLALAWPKSTPFSPFILSEGKITYITVNPVVAFKPLPTLSIAAGPTINYAEAWLRGAALAFRGDDTAVGFNAGILWQPSEKHSFGLSYRHSTTMNFDGHVTFPPSLHATSSGFNLPRNVVIGYSFRPTPDWNLEVDADWTDWDTLNTVSLKSAAPAVNLPFNWHSSWYYEFGVTRQLPHGWSASAGYIYSENSVPDASFNPVVPDSDRHIFSLGVGRKAGLWAWNFAYQVSWGPSRTINNPPPGKPINGSYEF